MVAEIIRDIEQFSNLKNLTRKFKAKPESSMLALFSSKLPPGNVWGLQLFPEKWSFDLKLYTGLF